MHDANLAGEQDAARVRSNAQKKVGDPAALPGTVPSRVALRVFDEAARCDSPVIIEYLGGILASSHSQDEKDDRGIWWASLVARLPVLALHLHYLAYDAFRHIFLGRTDLDLALRETRRACRVCLPAEGVLEATGLSPGTDLYERVVRRASSDLVREDLFAQSSTSVGVLDLPRWRHVPGVGPGIVFEVTATGIELFLWAHGRGEQSLRTFLRDDVHFTAFELLGSVSDARVLSEMKRDCEKQARTERFETLQVDYYDNSRKARAAISACR